jgi:hypothetical protein
MVARHRRPVFVSLPVIGAALMLLLLAALRLLF